MKTQRVKKALNVQQQAYDNFHLALEYMCVCACVCVLMRVCIYVWREREKWTSH